MIAQLTHQTRPERIIPEFVFNVVTGKHYEETQQKYSRSGNQNICGQNQIGIDNIL